MNKYHRSSLQLILIVTTTLVLSIYWLDLEIGYGNYIVNHSCWVYDLS